MNAIMIEVMHVKADIFLFFLKNPKNMRKSYIIPHNRNRLFNGRCIYV